MRCARRANGIPSAANSSADQPTPIPSVSRPSHKTSSVAICLAASTGLCSGSSKIPVARPIRCVTAAAKLRPAADRASRRQRERQSARLPSRDNGTGPVHHHHVLARPQPGEAAASAAALTARIMSGRAPVPMPSACSPNRKILLCRVVACPARVVPRSAVMHTDEIAPGHSSFGGPNAMAPVLSTLAR